MKRPAKKTTPRATQLDEKPLVKAMGEEAEDGADEGEGEEEDDDEEDEDEDDGVDKSLPTEGDLVKAMNDLASDADMIGSGGSLRKSELAMKLASEGALSKSENDEFMRLLAGDEGGDEPLQKSHRETFEEDPAVKDVVDVSPFLDAQNAALCKSLDDLRDGISNGNVESRAVAGKLAKGLSAVGLAVARTSRDLAEIKSLLKSMDNNAQAQPDKPRAQSRIGTRFGEEQPQGGAPMAKSLTGGQPGQPMLSQSQIGDTIQDLIKSTHTEGARGTAIGVIEGVDFVKEAAKLEGPTRMISPSAMRIVMRKRGLDPSAIGL